MTQAAAPFWTPVREALRQLDEADKALGRPLNVMILGAGMAGLVAGLELAKRCHKVTIYEASSRPGGRVWTHRFQDGSHAERGAMRIPNVHDYTRHYTDVAGLLGERVEFSNANLKLDVRGQVVSDGSQLIQRELLTEEERKAAEGGVGAILGVYMGPVMKKLADDKALRTALMEGDFRIPQLQAWDAVSWQGFLLSQKASEHAMDLFARVLNLACVWQWSFAAILRDELHQYDTKSFWGLKGGMDRLPRRLVALAEAAGFELHYEHKAEQIALAPGGRGAVTFAGVGARSFQFLICTLPIPVMRRPQFLQSGFSNAKRLAIEDYRYLSSNKVVFHYKRALPEQRAGRIVSDQGIDGGFERPFAAGVRQAYFLSTRPYAEPVALADATATEPELFQLHTGGSAAPEDASADVASADALAGPSVLLASYTIEAGARSHAMDDRQVIEKVLGSLRRSYPDLPTPDNAFVHRWDRAEHFQGALGITTPNLLSRYFQALKEPSGRVYFAGEHVSIAPGWIQGSLESALREVRRLLVDAKTDADVADLDASA